MKASRYLKGLFVCACFLLLYPFPSLVSVWGDSVVSSGMPVPVTRHQAFVHLILFFLVINKKNGGKIDSDLRSFFDTVHGSKFRWAPMAFIRSWARSLSSILPTAQWRQPVHQKLERNRNNQMETDREIRLYISGISVRSLSHESGRYGATVSNAEVACCYSQVHD